jgi:hypothetical protein
MPKRRTERAEPKPSALIVSDDDDTLLRLRDYLVRAGVETEATRRLGDAWGGSASQSIVLLPDDFDSGEVTGGLGQLLLRTPSPFVIIVTAGPGSYEPLIESLGNPSSVVIVPKPVWGWTILDLLRQWQQQDLSGSEASSGNHTR